MPSTSSPHRKTVAREIANRTPRAVPNATENGTGSHAPATKISDYFGINTLGVRQMRDKLPRDAYSRLISAVRLGNKLPAHHARRVASVIRDWAIPKGATHFPPWSQPQPGPTAEKHDAFLSFDDG